MINEVFLQLEGINIITPIIYFTEGNWGQMGIALGNYYASRIFQKILINTTIKP